MNRLVYERFGSKNGLLRYVSHLVLGLVGYYRSFSAIRPIDSQRLVFICSGNICRSPLAEVYANSLGWQAVSCGLHCGDGFPADPRARQFAERQGLNLNDHKTVNVKDFQFMADDFIVVMEPAHIAAFREQVGWDHQLVLAGSYCNNSRPYIHDPFNCCEEYFNYCETKVMEAVRGLCA